MSVSDNVVIMTKEEFEAYGLKVFGKGVERGRFQQQHDEKFNSDRGRKLIANQLQAIFIQAS